MLSYKSETLFLNSYLLDEDRSGKSLSLSKLLAEKLAKEVRHFNLVENSRHRKGVMVAESRRSISLARRKYLSKFVLVLIVLLMPIGFSLLSPFPASATASTNPTDVTSTSNDCSSAILASSVALNYQAATSLAESSSVYQNATQEFASVTYNGMFEGWSYDSSCNLQLKNVNVVFGLSNQTSFVEWLVITEDANLSSVASSGVQQNSMSSLGSTVASSNWAGWEFYGNSAKTAKIYESEVDYTVPTAQWPGGCKNYYTCDVAVWAGLEDESGAGDNHLAQAGTISQIQCDPGCVTTYWAVYDQLPNNFVSCYGITGLAAGDSMHVTVTNEAAYGGSNTKYDYLVNDDTRLKACSWTGISYTSLSAPTMSAHITEWPHICGPVDCSSLAKFPTFTTYGSMLIGGVLYGVYYAYENGWYVHDNPMENWCNIFFLQTNAQAGTVNSNSGWTTNWVSSCGTN